MNPLVTNTPVPAKGKVLGFRSMQNPRQWNVASRFPAQRSSSLLTCLMKWVWTARWSRWSRLAPWLRHKTLKSFNRLRETSSSGTSLSLQRSVTCRRVFSFLDRLSTTQGTNRCLYDFHLLWNRVKALLNIQINDTSAIGNVFMNFLSHFRYVASK